MSSATIPEAARRHACPGCGKPSLAAFDPFCGQGCRDRDLLQWLSDGYRIPGPPADDYDDSVVCDGLDS